MYAVQFDEFNFSDADVELVNEAVDALFKYIHIQNARKAQRHSIKSNEGIIKAIECKLGTGMVDSHGNEIFEGDDVRILGDGWDEVLRGYLSQRGIFPGGLVADGLSPRISLNSYTSQSATITHKSKFSKN